MHPFLFLDCNNPITLWCWCFSFYTCPPHFSFIIILSFFFQLLSLAHFLFLYLSSSYSRILPICLFSPFPLLPFHFELVDNHYLVLLKSFFNCILSLSYKGLSKFSHGGSAFICQWTILFTLWAFQKSSSFDRSAHANTSTLLLTGIKRENFLISWCKLQKLIELLTV